MTELKNSKQWRSTGELKEQVLANAPKAPSRWQRYILFFVLGILLMTWAFNGSQFDLFKLLEGRQNTVEMMARMWNPDFKKVKDISAYSFPQELSFGELVLPLGLDENKAKIKRRWWNNTFPQTIVGATIQTIQMALTGTFLALIFAFPLAFLAASNTSPHPFLYRSIRFVINLGRTIPDLALGLVFVAAVGLGPFAGTLALAIHTITVLTKLLSESIENIDEGVVDAVRATGASYPQVLSFAVVPQMLPDLISFTLYRFETNIRAAAVLGLIGAGGIGYLMNTAFRTFQYEEAAAIILILIILVMLVDWVSARLRKMVI